MRRPIEGMSQRVLAYELLLAIDRAMDAERRGRKVSYDPLHRLLQGHPIGASSSHVRHNLGRARREWLDDLMARTGPSAGP